LSVYDKLAALKIKLPEATAPVAAFLHFVRVGSLVFLSGHIAKKNGAPWVGQLGVNVTTEQGKEAARGVAIDLIGTLNAATGISLLPDTGNNKPLFIVALSLLVSGVVIFTVSTVVARKSHNEA